ncbi:MAG: hypothetical protein JSV90_05485 [Methanobacteriota archaeon]|nr:MAG: hypothetical protein JSV90_05485 [Euryarchaeota archaeon]
MVIIIALAFLLPSLLMCSSESLAKGPAPKWDLMVEDLWWETPQEGEFGEGDTEEYWVPAGAPVRVFVKIKNIGQDDIPNSPHLTMVTTISIDDDLKFTHSRSGQGLDSGESYEVMADYDDSQCWISGNWWTHTYEAEVDGVYDQDYDNNVKERGLTSFETYWTFIHYACAGPSSDPLDNPIEYNLQNMGTLVGSNEIVSIVALVDWTTYNGGYTKAYYITQDPYPPDGRIEIPLNHINPAWTGNELDMSDPQTLVDFGLYCVNRFTADKTALSMQGHGGGKAGTMQEANLQLMSIGEFGDAVYSIHLDLAPNRFELLIMDSCHMGMTELAYEVYNEVDYLVAAECDTIAYSGDGSLRWREILEYIINTNPYAGGLTVGDKLVVDYVQHWRNSWLCELSNMLANIRCANIPELATRVSAFSDALLAIMSPDTRAAVANAIAATQEYDDRSFDLVDFTEEVEARIADTTVDNCAQDIQDYMVEDGPVVTEIEIDSDGGDMDISQAHGLAIYIPENLAFMDVTYDNRGPWWFYENYHWDDFLVSYFGGRGTLFTENFADLDDWTTFGDGGFLGLDFSGDAINPPSLEAHKQQVTGETRAYREFTTQAGNFYIEARMKVATMCWGSEGWAYFTIGAGSAASVTFCFQQGYLKWYEQDDQHFHSVMAFSVDTPYLIGFDINVQAGTYDIYVDDVLKWNDAELRQGTGVPLDRVTFQAGWLDLCYGTHLWADDVMLEGR